MTGIPKIGPRVGPGQRNIDIRLTMREALVLHGALRDKEAELRKDAWWAGERGNPGRAGDLNDRAAENADLAERLFKILDGMMELKR